MNKFHLRKKILKIRKKNFNKNLKININSFISFLKLNTGSANNLGGYYPSNYEIDDLEILGLLEKKKFKISLPIIKKNNQMDFFKWSNNDPLKINQFGIPEPTSSKKIYPDILLVPLVAYDNHLNRLGYGGGFYDRTLKELLIINKHTASIGLAFESQKCNKLPKNNFDVPLNSLLNEKGFLHFKNI